MPRIAIKDYDTSFFHVMVQGIKKEYIFNQNEDKKVYLNYMNKYLDKYDVKVIAFCIMDNHAHILFYVENKKNMSEYMRCINTSYAMYYNKKYKRVGYVFKNRYKVEPIYNERYLINCIHYIHDNPIKAKICNDMAEYKYSSYIEYIRNIGKIIKKCNSRYEKINSLFINQIKNNDKIDYSFMDYVETEILKKKDVMRKFLKENKLNKNDIKLDLCKFRNIAIKLNKECKMTHQEVADEFGVSRIKITRLINKN